jgi:hypothetical protein
MIDRNVGNADRVIRILVGIAIIVIGVVMHSWWGLVGLLPITTGLIRFCGLYTLLGIRTCPKPGTSSSK